MIEDKYYFFNNLIIISKKLIINWKFQKQLIFKNRN
jgi:hypothetical protein